MSKYRIVPIQFDDGERYRLLVEKETGIPLWYPNLYVTTQVRNSSKSVATMDLCLRSIKVWLEYCDSFQIPWEEQVESGRLFSPPQIEGLRNFAQRKFQSKKGRRVSRKARDTVLVFPERPPARVSKAYEYQRLTCIAYYLGWYARTLTAAGESAAEEKEIESMVKMILSKRPPFKPSITKRDKALADSQFDLLMEIIEPDHLENPFKARDIAVRNALIIHLLANLGIRRGELLGIRIRDINVRAREITIHRRPDEVADPRVRQPNTKTEARTIPFGDKLTDLILEYITKIRQQIKGARTHDYLIVVHGHGPYRGKALSESGLGKIFDAISRAKPELLSLHPHAMRHTWNWKFSQSLDELPKDKRPSPAEEEQIRNHVMGWRQGSGTAASYNRRHIERKAREAAIIHQDRMRRTGLESHDGLRDDSSG